MVTVECFNSIERKLIVCQDRANDLMFELDCVRHNSGTDEPYKVTGDPDFDALGEVQRHLDEAREALERFVGSLTKP